jgi:hypothetical protein
MSNYMINNETQNLLKIIKLRELYRYKDVLVHYRYGFTPKQECSIAELAWGFVKDPWCANEVASKLKTLLPDIRDEPPVFVREWENLETSTATMEITSETTVIDLSSHIFNPLILPLDMMNTEPVMIHSPAPLDNEYDDMPPLEECDSDNSDNDNDLPPPLINFHPLEECDSDESSYDSSSSWDDSSDDAPPAYLPPPPRHYLPTFQPFSQPICQPFSRPTSPTLDDLLDELEQVEIIAGTTTKEAPIIYGADYERAIEKAYTEYLLSKHRNDLINKEMKKTLDESIKQLSETAELHKVERYNVAENMNSYQVVEVTQPVECTATYETIVMPTPQRAILNPLSDDEVFVRVFTVQDLKWNAGPDLANPMKLPESQCFRMPKTATWGENLCCEIDYRTTIFDSPNKEWTPFVFSRRANGTIRPSYVMDDYIPLSKYQKNLNVRNEVWVLLLNIREPKINEVVLHKKWFHKGWFYYQGFEVVDKSAQLSTIMKYDIAFEEICAVGDEKNMMIEPLDPSSSIEWLRLDTGDIVIYSKMSQRLNHQGLLEMVNADFIMESFDLIKNPSQKFKID